MPMSTGNQDYRVRTGGHKNAGLALPPDNRAIEFFHALGRAARQFHTYPAASPLCVEAIDACQRAFDAIQAGAAFRCRISPSALIVDDGEIGEGTIIEAELARPLHRAHVAALEIDGASTRRDWSQLCAALLQCQRAATPATSFAEVLAQAGVTTITAMMAPRPEVLPVATPAGPVRDLVARERSRQQTLGGGPVQHFYPPDKGWILVDPSVPYDTVSLLDLTLLVDDPARLAGILMRLTDDDEPGTDAGRALEQKYADVVTLISALDPRLARILFARLARAVLDLDSDRRKALLRRTILPGLLDGRAEGEAVLAEFPEVDLADALCLLLDLETAAPELLSAALDRLNLPADRREAVVPLIEAKLRDGESGSTASRRFDAGLDQYAGALVRIDGARAQSFAEYAAFDLAINDQTRAALVQVCDAVAATDPIDAQLACLTGLIRLEPNPARAGVFIGRALPLLRSLIRARQWDQLAPWITRTRDIAAHLQAARPEIASALGEMIAALCDRGALLQLADLCGESAEGRARGRAVVAAFGRATVPAWLAALEAASDRPRLRPLSAIMAERARELGPAVAKRLRHCGPEAARAAVALLGFAGGGYEKVIADQLPRGDERTLREALHALARIGTTQAAAVLAEQIEHAPAPAATAAEDALWKLPPPVAMIKARELLGRREFVTSRPHAAARLLDRAAPAMSDDFAPVLEGLARLRYHFWDPAVMRVAARAREFMS
jgi:hypothetical protein